MFPADLLAKSELVITLLAHTNRTIVTAESCTGGLIASALTEIAGSSQAVYGGFVTYANGAKSTMLGVSEDILSEYGAVSKETARAMAEGARTAGDTDIAIAVTGIAGPGGGTNDKPVGLVHIACATRTSMTHVERRFGSGSRQDIRLRTVHAALSLVMQVASGEKI